MKEKYKELDLEVKNEENIASQGIRLFIIITY